MVFENLGDERAKILFERFKEKGLNDDDAWGEVYSIETNIDNDLLKFQFKDETKQGYKIITLIKKKEMRDDGVQLYHAIAKRNIKNTKRDMGTIIIPKDYVVLYDYDLRDGTWGQGHYYYDYNKAYDKFKEIL